MRKPDFLVIGAQRSGSSSFYHYLTQHPEVGAATKKELHYFDHRYYDETWEWYLSQFPDEEAQITGEATPYYLFHPHSPDRVAADLPDVKLIAVLRNPVDRAYSHWNRERIRDSEVLDFPSAINAEHKRLKRPQRMMEQNPALFMPEHATYSYLARGRYYEQLERWFGVFDRERFLILRSEDFFQAPSVIMSEVLGWLGVESDWFDFDFSKKVESKKYEAMSDRTREQLEAYFEPHNKKLYRLIDRDMGW